MGIHDGHRSRMKQEFLQGGLTHFSEPRALELLHRAKEEGLDVGCDVYPYTAGSTQLLHILPPEFLEMHILRQPSRNLMNALQQSVLSLYDYDPSPDDVDPYCVLLKGMNIMAKMPAIKPLNKYHWLTEIRSFNKTPAPIFLSWICFSYTNLVNPFEFLILSKCFFASLVGVVPEIR